MFDTGDPDLTSETSEFFLSPYVDSKVSLIKVGPLLLIQTSLINKCIKSLRKPPIYV